MEKKMFEQARPIQGYREYYNEESKGMRLEKIEEEIEYLKAENSRLEERIEELENLRGIDAEKILDIFEILEERIKEFEEEFCERLGVLEDIEKIREDFEKDSISWKMMKRRK